MRHKAIKKPYAQNLLFDKFCHDTILTVIMGDS